MESKLKMTLVVQAGGESRRMGTNKALIPFLGRPLISRVIDRLSPIADEVLVTSNQPDELAFLQLPVFKDILPGQGALSGLYTALSIANYPLVAVVACDMPFANKELLLAERMDLEMSKAAGVVPQSENGFEPFHAVYLKEVCIKIIQAAILSGKKQAISWYTDANMLFFNPEKVRIFDPNNRAFINVNTPEELQETENYARQIENRSTI